MGAARLQNVRLSFGIPLFRCRGELNDDIASQASWPIFKMAHSCFCGTRFGLYVYSFMFECPTFYYELMLDLFPSLTIPAWQVREDLPRGLAGRRRQRRLRQSGRTQPS